MAAAAILNLFESKIAPLDSPSPKTPLYNQTWSGSYHPLQRYGHLRSNVSDAQINRGWVTLDPNLGVFLLE